MAASHSNEGAEDAGRRKRYAREEGGPGVAVTAAKLRILSYLLDFRFLMVPQAAKLTSSSEVTARRHLRELFDGGLVERIAVPRAALADDGEANDPSLTYGSAPAIHVLSRGGIQALVDAGIAGREDLRRPVPSFGPQNSLFLRHEVFVRDVRVWLSTLEGCRLTSWQDGPEPGAGKGIGFRPDATFGLRVGGTDASPLVLAGFVEADRGTERGTPRWAEKLRAYASVFSSPDRTVAACGYRNARVLVVTRTAHRRDRLWEMVEQIGAELGLGPDVLERFWIADRTALDLRLADYSDWRVPGVEGNWPVIPDGIA